MLCTWQVDSGSSLMILSNKRFHTFLRRPIHQAVKMSLTHDIENMLDGAVPIRLACFAMALLAMRITCKQPELQPDAGKWLSRSQVAAQHVGKPSCHSESDNEDDVYDSRIAKRAASCDSGQTSYEPCMLHQRCMRWPQLSVQ